ncbi:MAG: DUF3472 domain-containing protein [Armatimonas sp.]
MKDTLRIPAFTAYSLPDHDNGARFSEERGVTNWKPGQRIAWYGKVAKAGKLEISLAARATQPTRLRLMVSPVGKRGAALEAAVGEGETRFGTVSVKPGYYEFALESLGANPPAIEALLLSGEGANGAHFNYKERRNAASVHLGWPTDKGEKIAVFYNEITAREEPIYTYYMACGFARGYFGIQVNSPNERRVIFSVWDSGNEAMDRNKVNTDDRVRLLEKGQGVFAGDFGNEGTGGHSHLVYPWKTGQTYRLAVAVKPDGTHTEYSGWFYFPDRRAWGLIVRFRAPKDGEWLRGLYSFSENFGGSNGDLMRRVEFGNGWLRLDSGLWKPQLNARFTCDATGRAKDRIDYAAGALGNRRFYLQQGGFKDNGVQFGDTFRIDKAAGSPPKDLPESLV